MGKKIVSNILPALALFVFIAIVYACSVPANHSEAEDAFDYAWEVENNTVSDLFHTNHLIYRPAMRMLWLGAKTAGYTGRAYPLMLAFSVIAGALSAALFFIFLRRIFADKDDADDRCGSGVYALPFALLLAFSYNFWRYAVEAEIYIPAILVSLILLLLVVAKRLSPRRTIAGAVLGAVAILTHISAGALVVLGVPAYYFRRRRWRLAAMHLLVVAVLLGAVYFPISRTFGFQDGSPLHSQPAEAGLQVENLARGAAAVGQSVVSGNFLFVSPALREAISARYPYRMLAEEKLMGARAPNRVFGAGSASLCLIALTSLALMVIVLIRRKRLLAEICRFKALAVLLLVWIGGYAAVMLLLEAGNPEMWIMLLPAIWLLAALCCRPLAAGRRGFAVLFALLLLLCMHNWIGGMSLLQDEAGDYNRLKAGWVLERAGAGDRVLTAGNPVFIFYMRYHCRGELVDLNTVDESDMRGFLESLARGQGRVYLLGDLFNPPESILQRFPDRRRRLALLARRLEPFVTRVHTNRFGGVFVLEENAAENPG